MCGSWWNILPGIDNRNALARKYSHIMPYLLEQLIIRFWKGDLLDARSQKITKERKTSDSVLLSLFMNSNWNWALRYPRALADLSAVLRIIHAPLQIFQRSSHAPCRLFSRIAYYSRTLEELSADLRITHAPLRIFQRSCVLLRHAIFRSFSGFGYYSRPLADLSAELRITHAHMRIFQRSCVILTSPCRSFSGVAYYSRPLADLSAEFCITHASLRIFQRSCVLLTSPSKIFSGVAYYWRHLADLSAEWCIRNDREWAHWTQRARKYNMHIDESGLSSSGLNTTNTVGQTLMVICLLAVTSCNLHAGASHIHPINVC